MDRVDESEGSKAIALKAIRGVFIERDVRVVQELFAPDYIQHNPTIPSGRDAIGALVGSLPEGFRYELGMVVAEGSIVMIHGRYVGWAPEPVGDSRTLINSSSGVSTTDASSRPMRSTIDAELPEAALFSALRDQRADELVEVWRQVHGTVSGGIRRLRHALPAGGTASIEARADRDAPPRTRSSE
jgi:predicted SnoaL-like aldol condensation-catalyzing enzyme